MRIVVVGSKGTLGSELVKRWNDPRIEERIAGGGGVSSLSTSEDDVVALNLPDFDVCSRTNAVETICDFRPDVIVNASGVNRIDWLESRPNTARTLHEHGPSNLREAAKRCDALFVQYSCGEVFYRSRLEAGATDARELVSSATEARSSVLAFDDESSLDLPIDPSSRGFVERTVPNPASVYAKTKLESERVCSEAPKSLVLRFSSLFGESSEYSCGNLVSSLLKAFCRTSRVSVLEDVVQEPLWAVDVVCATKTLIRLEARGLYHLTGNSRARPVEVGRYLLEKIGLRHKTVVGITRREYGVTAPTSAFTVLESERYGDLSGAYQIPDWRVALDDYLSWRQPF